MKSVELKQVGILAALAPLCVGGISSNELPEKASNVPLERFASKPDGPFEFLKSVLA